MKKIHVFPNAMLSLQKHQFRSEHWIIVEGVANVTIGKKVNVVKSGESVFVPKGELHRLHNPSEIPMVLIEVQIGTYFGEDDIIRLEDIYDRIGK